MTRINNNKYIIFIIFIYVETLLAARYNVALRACGRHEIKRSSSRHTDGKIVIIHTRRYGYLIIILNHIPREQKEKIYFFPSTNGPHYFNF